MTQEHLHFENLISELSGLLSHVPFGKANQEIARGLELIRHSFDMDCCGLMEVDAERKQVQMVIASWGEESERLADSLPGVNGLSWVYRRVVEEGLPMAFPSLGKLPPEAKGEKDFWQTSGIESLIMIPLYFGGRVTHLLGLANGLNGRELPENYSQRLGILGKMVAKEVIHRSDWERLRRREHQLVEAQHVAPLGVWEWDLVSGGITWSEGIYRILGVEPREGELPYENFLAILHPQDRDRVQKAVEECLSCPGKVYSSEHRFVRADGSERVVQAYGEVIRDSDGNPVGMLGTSCDVSDRRRIEGELEKALEEIKKLRELAGMERVNVRGEVKFQKRFPDIVGMSDPLRYVLYRIGQVAPTKTTVLLLGETGTGKGLFARALHEASNRKEKPFVNVNCAGLAPNLIESELFGREKGAFTGSTERQIGRFELAHGGTIFLDEIGELPLDLQSKLLKVIESGEFERLGSPRSIKVDVRIVASTNRNIMEEIDKGRFRKDLFYRLSVFPITIPPLRQRKEDIPLLVNHYVESFGKSHGKDVKIISEETMKILEDHSWPGNVRELINVVERAVIMSEGPELRLLDKLDGIPFEPPLEEAPKLPPGGERKEKKGLVEVEREHILKTLQETEWKLEGRNGAAQFLQMNASTLRARMRKLGIKRVAQRRNVFSNLKSAA